MISFASFWAFRSRSLKSAAERSSLVVYISSSKLVLTPYNCSLAANWSHDLFPALAGPKVRSSPNCPGGGLVPSEPGCQACNSRSRPPLPFPLISVSVLKAKNSPNLSAMFRAFQLRSLTVTVWHFGVGGAGGVTVDVCGSDEQRIFERCPRTCDIFDVFQCHASCVAFCVSGGNHALIALCCLGQNRNSCSL